MSTATRHLLSTALSAAVPLRIMEMQQRGGPDDADLDRARSAAQLLACSGDKLMFRSKKQGETAHVFNETAFGVAVLAFCPGGVTLFGQHYDATFGGFGVKGPQLKRLKLLRKRVELLEPE